MAEVVVITACRQEKQPDGSWLCRRCGHKTFELDEGWLCLEGNETGATISADGLYRYELTRRWAPPFKPPVNVCWVMLNPSIADAEVDDPTIRRVKGFSTALGFGGCVVVNLFALRATDPRDLADSREAGIDPVGPKNDLIAGFWIRRSALVIAAWGAHGMARDREAWFFEQAHQAKADVRCLGLTKGGFPRHPLYVPGATQLAPFELHEGAA